MNIFTATFFSTPPSPVISRCRSETRFLVLLYGPFFVGQSGPGRIL